jgi:hypothetical protein
MALRLGRIAASLRMKVLVCVAVALAACDTRAQPTSATAGPVSDPDRLSAEHETCGTTLHCGEGLRCFDGTCQRTERSVVGDYHAALGEQRLAAGDLEGALAAYGEALKRYGLEKLTVPVAIECGYGAALASGRKDKERAELAARVLHRCVAGAPAGSALRDAGLRAIAVLDESGLDPEHLLRDEADVYLSRAPARPKTEELKVEVTASPLPTARSWPATVEAIKGARAALVACWEKQKGPSISVGVPMSSVYKDSGYDDEPSYYLTGVDPKGAPASGEVDQCVRDAIGPAVKGVKGGGSWAAMVTVTVQ